MLPEPEGEEYVEVRDSALHGRGLFAAVDIPKGSYIIEYKGEKVRKKEGTRRAMEQWEDGRIYIFQLNKRHDLDGLVDGNVARLANFSCDPNAESLNEDGKRIWLAAMKHISKGDEITFDYHLDFQEPPAECHCGTARCIGYMVGPHGLMELRDWLKDEGLPVNENLRKAIKREQARARREANA